MWRHLSQVLTPDEQDKQKRQNLARFVDKLVKSGLNYHEGMFVLPYGSFVSDLYTPTGDVDLAIEGIMRPQ